MTKQKSKTKSAKKSYVGSSGAEIFNEMLLDVLVVGAAPLFEKRLKSEIGPKQSRFWETKLVDLSQRGT